MSRLGRFQTSDRSPRYRAIVVEQDPDHRQALAALLLTELRCDVTTSDTILTAHALFRALKPELVTLDPLAGAIDEAEAFCRGVRDEPATAATAIVLLGQDCPLVRRLGLLRCGADLVLEKRDMPSTLLAGHLRALLRRAGPPRRLGCQLGPVTLFDDQHSAVISGETIHLGPVQFEIFRALVRDPYCVQSSGALRAILRRRLARPMSSTALRRNVTRLRRKLGSHAGIVKTVSGRGYCLHERASPTGSRASR